MEFELYCVHAASTRLLARSALPLRPLLGMRGRSVHPSAPLLLVGSGDADESLLLSEAPGRGRGGCKEYVAGCMCVEMQLQRPLAGVAESVLGPRRGWPQLGGGRPGQAGAHAQAMPLYASPGAGADTRCRFLRVQVLGCDGLPMVPPHLSSPSSPSSAAAASSSSSLSRHQRPPSAYVHYQFLGFEDVLTGVVEASTDPRFEHSVHWFPIHLAASSGAESKSMMAQFLERYRLCFTVLDDGVPEGVDNVIASTEVRLLLPDHDGEGHIEGSMSVGGKYQLTAAQSGDDGSEGKKRASARRAAAGVIYVDIEWTDVQ